MAAEGATGAGTAANGTDGATTTTASGLYASMSTRMTLPPGPVPLTFASGIPCSNANRFARGEASILSVESSSGAVEGAAGSEVGAGVGTSAAAGLSRFSSSAFFGASDACARGASVESLASASRAAMAVAETSSPSSANIAITDPTGIDLDPSEI